MRFEGPIDIRPLTVRGTLGIAWQIVRRSFASLFFYALLMQLILALGLFVAFSPVLGSVIKGSFDGFDFVVEILVALMLLLLFLLAYVLLFNPVLQGTLYGELSSRMYANGASCTMLFRRSKHSLKRFFTTALCLIVCGIAISTAESILSGISGGIFGFAGVAAALPSMLAGSFTGNPLDILTSLGAGMFVFLGIVSLLSWGIMLCGQSLICFTYPVVVNENLSNFDAVGRSIKLTSKRFGRVLGCKLLFFAALLIIQTVLSLACALVLAFSVDAFAANAAWSVPLIIVLALASIVLGTIATVYAPALDTVLYYDARTRAEGRAWLGMDQPAAGSAPLNGDEARYEQPQQPQNNPDQNGGEYGA